MLILFYLLAIEQILQGLHNLWDGVRWVRMARRRLGTHSGFYAPRVALICPLKGTESGLEENLGALMGFDYPEYEIFFTMASSDDPARKILDRISSSSKRKTHLVIAGRAEDCGEKVNNLRAATQKASEGFDVYVFVDSDGRPGRNWLTHLVAPLGNSSIGAVTTYRWYFRRRNTFWSALASAWNAPGATYLGEHEHNFCWGGGTAIRRESFEQARVFEFWHHAVSDDLSMTQALRAAGLPILFAPECLVPSVIDCSAAELVEFTNRQIIITRVYEPRLWALGGIGHLLYCSAILLGLGICISNWITGTTAIHILLLALALPVLSMARGVLRLTAVTELLPEWKARLLADGWIWTLLAAAAPFLSLWNSGVALFTHRIQWRGVRYELISPDQTRVIGR